jgi:hypothetical protein
MEREESEQKKWNKWMKMRSDSLSLSLLFCFHHQRPPTLFVWVHSVLLRATESFNLALLKSAIQDPDVDLNAFITNDGYAVSFCRYCFAFFASFEAFLLSC